MVRYLLVLYRTIIGIGQYGVVMKTNPLLRSIALLGSLALPTTLHAMEVHEWGTFTKKTMDSNAPQALGLLRSYLLWVDSFSRRQWALPSDVIINSMRKSWEESQQSKASGGLKNSLTQQRSFSQLRPS
jgi:hypothetical protein